MEWKPGRFNEFRFTAANTRADDVEEFQKNIKRIGGWKYDPYHLSVKDYIMNEALYGKGEIQEAAKEEQNKHHQVKYAAIKDK